MSKKARNKRMRARDAPPQKRSMLMTCSMDGWTELLNTGYKPLTSCPEVQMAVGVYADLIANMTIMLMKNTEIGDVRVHNGLSRRLDIEPHRNMTHQTFMSHLVRVLLTTGNQVTVPRYSADGLIEDLQPLPPSKVNFTEDGEGYRVRYGERFFAPDEVLHFPLNPDPEKPWMGTGYAVALRDVTESLRQSAATRNALMASPAPSIIVRVNGLMDDMQTEEGRERVRDQYMTASETGKPWLVPAEAFEVEQVKPLTLNDLAIEKSIELDKRSAAAIVGVPAFLVGVGAFDEKEFNWFVATRVMSIARIFEQEFTRKLLLSPELYFRFNNRSLLNYNLAEVISAGQAMVDRMAMTRNEWRDWIGLPPNPDMDELLALENYIPASMVGQQKKLTGGETDGNES